MLKKAILLLSLFNFLFALYSQDSIQAIAPQIDTLVIDTVVIRKDQEKIKYILRGVKLLHPKVTFNNTNTLDKKPKKFRVPSFWEKINFVSLSISEVAFVNWNAGGNNSISGLTNFKMERNYKFRYISWKNILSLKYGLNTQEGQQLRKTDDEIRFSSTFGYRRDTISNWYYSARANLKTQFSDGFKYPDRENPISRPFAPGYFFLGAGTSYIKEDGKFNLYLSPLTLKSTIVLDQELANKGSFGVEKAVIDADGNIIKQGKNYFFEVGLLINNTLDTQIAKNIDLKNRVSFYTDYLKDFGNIDVDWQLDINLRINKYIATNIGTHVIYDNDILFGEEIDDNGFITKAGGARIQFKQLFGVGISYDF